jgi:hypothetical protein
LLGTNGGARASNRAPPPVQRERSPAQCERGESHDENRLDSTVKRVDIDQADLMVPRLTDARLTMEEQAGFKPLPR